MCGNDETFVDAISNGFDKIKQNFINKCNALEYEFDEDLFMDAFLNCHNTLKDKKMPKGEHVKYYWVSYLNKLKTEKAKESKFIGFEDIGEQKKSCIDSYSYNPHVDNDYNAIIELVRSKYDQKYVDAWILHVCEDKTYKELKEMGYNFKFNDVFKRITKYVRKEYKGS